MVGNWDHQDMDRRLRVDVMEGNNMLIFINLAGWNDAFDDFAEKTVHANLLARCKSASSVTVCG